MHESGLPGDYVPSTGMTCEPREIGALNAVL